MRKTSFIIPVVVLSLIACEQAKENTGSSDNSSIVSSQILSSDSSTSIESSSSSSLADQTKYQVTYQDCVDFFSEEESFTISVAEKRLYKSSYANGEADFNSRITLQKDHDLFRYVRNIDEYITFTEEDFAEFFHIDINTVKDVLSENNSHTCIDAESGVWQFTDKSGTPKDKTQKKIDDTYREYDNLKMIYSDVDKNAEIIEEIISFYAYTEAFKSTIYNESEHCYEISNIETLKKLEIANNNHVSGYIRYYFEDKAPVKITINLVVSEKHYSNAIIEFSDIGSTTIDLVESNYTEYIEG